LGYQKDEKEERLTSVHEKEEEKGKKKAQGGHFLLGISVQGKNKNLPEDERKKTRGSREQVPITLLAPLIALSFTYSYTSRSSKSRDLVD